MKIDKGIPITDIRRVRRKYYDVYEIAAKMEIGDSFIAPTGAIYRGSFMIKHRLEHKHGIKLAQRKTPEGLRIWRTA